VRLLHALVKIHASCDDPNPPITQWITQRSPNDEETQVSTVFLSSRRPNVNQRELPVRTFSSRDPDLAEGLEAKAGPVGVGQRHVEDSGAGNPPVSLAATGPFSGVALGDTA
jgi:hypothetical protein